MNIGIIDLDTSHPQNWIPIERELGHEIVGVWDGGSVHPPAYVAEFARAHAIPQVFPSLDEMVTAVDCVILHGCDWDTHIAKARPFVEAGKAVLIDKPLAGNLRDLQQIRDWRIHGARIAGGSSLLFAEECAAWLSLPLAERGNPHSVFCGCGVDEFNYGIHAYALAISLLGGGVVSAQFLTASPQQHVRLRWSDGRSATIVVGAAAVWLPFYATVVSDRTVHHFTANVGTLYRRLLEQTLPYLAGESDTAPLDLDVWLLPETCALAARASQQRAGQEVKLQDQELLQASYAGQPFAESYRHMKYPVQASG